MGCSDDHWVIPTRWCHRVSAGGTALMGCLPECPGLLQSCRAGCVVTLSLTCLVGSGWRSCGLCTTCVLTWQRRLQITSVLVPSLRARLVVYTFPRSTRAKVG